ncbi:vWA domain-containing protein [Azospirillum sp. HJ39]|uniref:vWA domain-containing protein n=1 Tax=Azospirillum sp. HJ39 TaxID=3159496 RepID=UPI003555E00F
MTLAFDDPAILLLLPLAALPLATPLFVPSALPSLSFLPRDPVSTGIDIGLRLAAALAILTLILGLAGLHRVALDVERIGRGAPLVLLLDRSSSMDDGFAGRPPDGDEETKSATARRLLIQLLARRPHDRVGIVAFSTAPMPVLPVTDQRAAVLAAIGAIDRPGLAYTDVGRGLVLAFSMVALDRPDGGPDPGHAVLLVSDGAAVIDRRVQEALRDAAVRTPLHLYWLFLRTKGSRGIFDEPQNPGEDTPQAMPERHLHRFLAGLGVSYRAFEATSAQAVEAAIGEIDSLESRPVRFWERIPRRDLAGAAYAGAAACVGLLMLAKLAERRPAGGRVAADGGGVIRHGKARAP